MKWLGALGLMLTAAAACGCAGTSDTPPTLIADGVTPPPITAPPAATATVTPVAASGYQLSEQELKYDCKKLTGTMQIRILQIRDYETSKKTSTLARTAQAVATPIWGGTTVGIDPDGQYRKDLAMLEAYNQRLAEKKCKTFDLAAEMQSRDAHDTPRPVHKPAAQ